MQNLDIKQLLQRSLDLLDARVTEFEHFAGVGEDHMIMLLDAVTLFVLRHLVAKLMLAHQIAIDEQVHGVVKSSAADAMPLRGHVRQQRIDVEVAVVRVDLLQNGKALRGLAVSVLLEVGFE